MRPSRFLLLLGASLCQTLGFTSTLNRLADGGALPIAAAMSLDGSVSVRVNGEHRRVPDGTSVAEMVGLLGLDPLRVAVERNLEVIPRSRLGKVSVEDGDDFEIVHFVGGG